MQRDVLVNSLTKGFTMIPNSVFTDNRLSMGARVLLGYLISKPEGWKIYNAEITKSLSISNDTLAKYYKELIACGWLQRTLIRNEDKKFSGGYQYKLLNPFTEKSRIGKNVGFGKTTELNNTNTTSNTETTSKTETTMFSKGVEIREKVSTEQPIGEQVAKPQKSSFERLTEWYCRHFVVGSEERKKQFLKDFGFFFYDLLDRCNDSVRLAGCVIKICKERYKCELEGILSNFDNVLADAMTQAFGANPIIDTKKLEKDINKPRRKKTTLQIFSNFVLSKYEANGNNFTDNQKKVWFSRNCKSMSDILKFCENDIELALECVKVCAERLEKAGFEGGLDAVARNINTYYMEAKKRLKRS